MLTQTLPMENGCYTFSFFPFSTRVAVFGKTVDHRVPEPSFFGGPIEIHVSLWWKKFYCINNLDVRELIERRRGTGLP